MAKKMCKYDKFFPMCNGYDGRKCPSNVGDGCEIITKKKVRRVKAWAIWCVNNKKDGPWIEACSKGDKLPGSFPCIIEADEKWLKEKK